MARQRQPLSEEHKAKIRAAMKARNQKPSTVKEEKVVGEKKQPKAVPDALSVLLGSISQEVNDAIDRQVTEEFAELRKAATRNAKLDVTIDGKTNTVKGLRHFQLEELIKITSLRLPVLLVGMAGTGKTHAAEQVGEALGLPYFTMSVGAQTSKTDIVGYMNANGTYVKTHFRTAFEQGGVFLMDEIDAGNANVLIQVNAALSNGACAFPDAMVKKHPNFVFIASANTYGTGMNRQYVGRNQLDAATLDRFTIIDWGVDATLEQQLAIGEHGTAWFKAVGVVREYVAKHNIRALITPRATQKGAVLLQHGFHVRDVVPAVLLGSVPDDKKEDITKVALEVFGLESTGQKKS
jgi:cobaltochelatase CobS